VLMDKIICLVGLAGRGVDHDYANLTVSYNRKVGLVSRLKSPTVHENGARTRSKSRRACKRAIAFPRNTSAFDPKKIPVETKSTCVAVEVAPLRSAGY